MNLSLIALIVVAAVAPQRAVAQAIAPAGVVNRPVVADTTPRFSKGHSFLIRSLTGALGFVAGGAVGWGLATGTGGQHRNFCDFSRQPPTPCPSDPLEDLLRGLVGSAIGGALGASLGASAPTLSAKCSFGARMLRSTAGSVAGAALGTAISANVARGGGAVVGLPVGSVLGASAALIGC